MNSERPAAAVDPREPSLRDASLADVSARGFPRPDSVTAVIRHRVRADALADYERWLERIVPVAQRFPGHRGVDVIRPVAGSSLYTVTIRFDSLAHADDWFQSSARQTLLAELLPLLSQEEQRETVTGLEFWFRPEPGQKPARRYKQFLLTLAVIYPLTLLVPMPIRWLARRWTWLDHTLLIHLLVAAVIVGLMTYVLMPRLTRWLAKWLYG
ncbi:antibiotic biosynthesis monooxygenase [Tahibacter caeni]|uniref:antibiotic biosynthesis monooxygenase n=1 Tax=Tahibacter caeni TaxID=1453545 RepID=UPI0021477580|nr:antibiotic biosynthesis monooxygenase [Tahibacter caeni]